ncbi:hypothetical protein KEM52_003280, partial [Ascosphaera acerosa]
IQDLRMPFVDYIADLNCDSNASSSDGKASSGDGKASSGGNGSRRALPAWTVVMKLATDFVRLPDLLRVSQLRNLVALEIKTQPQPPEWMVMEELAAGKPAAAGPRVQVTDRVVRSWGELARAGAGFQQLRILMLRAQPDVTAHLVSQLALFPALVGVAVVECPGLQTEAARECAARYGWTVYDIKKRAQTGKTVLDLLLDYLASPSADEQEREACVDVPLAQLRRTPLLECCIELPLVETRKLLPHIRLFTRSLPASTASHWQVEQQEQQSACKRPHSATPTWERQGTSDGGDVPLPASGKKPRRRPAMRAGAARKQQDMASMLAEMG